MKDDLCKGKNVCLYHDAGVGGLSLAHGLALFQSLGAKVKTLSSHDVKHQSWQKDTNLFVMPGGAAAPYAHKLGSFGNAILRSYVKEGGAYLGICAGAYYGCAGVEFDKGGPQEVITNRDLALFKGRALGPVIAPYEPSSQETCQAVRVQTFFEGEDPLCFEAFYNGGGTFEPPCDKDGVQVLGLYAQQKLPAILGFDYGRGKVFLSGVHFEYDPFSLPFKDPYLERLSPILKTQEDQRKALVGQICRFFGLCSSR